MNNKNHTIREKIGAALLAFLAAGGGALGIQAWKAHERETDYRAAGFPSAPSYSAFKEEWRRVESMPAYAQWKTKLRDNQLFDATAQLTSKGLPRLGETDLQARTELLLRVMENQNSKFCSYLVRGTGLDPKLAASALLDSIEKYGGKDAIRRWSSMSANAAIASLQDYPQATLTDDQVAGTFQRVFAKLPDQTYDSILSLVLNPGEKSDRDACDLGMTMYRTTLQAKPPDKLNMMRILVSE